MCCKSAEILAQLLDHVGFSSQTLIACTHQDFPIIKRIVHLWHDSLICLSSESSFSIDDELPSFNPDRVQGNTSMPIINYARLLPESDVSLMCQLSRRSHCWLSLFLAYTIVAMHANFVLCLFSTSDQPQSTRTCFQSCGACLRRFFRRFCFCLVICIWSFSFTTTIPLLYTLDSNEKAPKPVYCPGTTQISYLEEWFDRNRMIQTVLFNLVPLLISLFLSLIALLKLLSEALHYCYLRVATSRCSPCARHRRRRFSVEQAERASSMLNSTSVLPAIDCRISNHLQIAASNSETTDPYGNENLRSCGNWCSTSFMRFLMVFSSCLLACIYPIAMRFYLIYFSVLVPLIFTVINYSLGPSAPSAVMSLARPSISTVEHHRLTPLRSPAIITSSSEIPNSFNTTVGKYLSNATPPENDRKASSNEQLELRSPLIVNLLHEHDEREESLLTPSTIDPTQNHRRTNNFSKQKYFANHLYENTRNIFRR